MCILVGFTAVRANNVHAAYSKFTLNTEFRAAFALSNSNEKLKIAQVWIEHYIFFILLLFQRKNWKY